MRKLLCRLGVHKFVAIKRSDSATLTLWVCVCGETKYVEDVI